MVDWWLLNVGTRSHLDAVWQNWDGCARLVPCSRTLLVSKYPYANWLVLTKEREYKDLKPMRVWMLLRSVLTLILGGGSLQVRMQMPHRSHSKKQGQSRVRSIRARMTRGFFAPLEKVAVPEGTEVTIIMDLPDYHAPRHPATVPTFPDTRLLAPFPLTRREIYEES